MIDEHPHRDKHCERRTEPEGVRDQDGPPWGWEKLKGVWGDRLKLPRFAGRVLNTTAAKLRDEVCRNGTLAQHHRLHIPRSTAATWRNRGPRPVVTLEEFDHDRQQLLDRVEKLRRRTQVLAAVVRLLFSLLRISGFRLSGARLPAGDDKARLLRAIAAAHPILPLVRILRIVGMTPSRYHAWRRATEVCGLDDWPSCPRSMPSRLGADAVPILAVSHEELEWVVLPTDASRLLAHMDGVRSLEVVRAMANIAADDCAAILLDLVDQGIVSFL